jgi:hypothetical protein
MGSSAQEGALYMKIPPIVVISHKRYVWSEEYLDNIENPQERKHTFGDVEIVSAPNISLSSGRKCKRYINLPDHPTVLQKVIAFCAVQTGIVSFARRKGNYPGFAFSRTNAREIFAW